MKPALQIILGISLLGLAFSGYLTAGEMFAAHPAETCEPVGAPGTVLGYPPCVYGFFMYLAVTVTATVGLWLGRRARSGGSSARGSSGREAPSRAA